MTLAVSNTGPLLHLSEAQALDLLALLGKVHIPEAVRAEVSLYDVGLRQKRPAWLTVHSLQPPYSAEAAGWQRAGLLQAGEAESIALARQLRADWLLTDDAAARLFAQSLGLEVHGSLGVVLWAAAAGRLEHAAARRALERLAKSSLWISARVLTEARAALERLSSSGD